MKTQKLFQYTSVALVVILLFSAGPVQGQEPEPLPEEDPEGTEFILAQPPYTMNYQGYLTDSGGTPLNGTYDLAFALYDDVSAGTMEWGTEAHNSTQVTNGLFQVALGNSVALEPDVFDEALFLAVRVNGTWLSPRQPLHAVPYAFGLVPGAEVQGEPPAGSSYALYVDNTGTGSLDRGIYGGGSQYGIYANSYYGTYAIYSADVTYSSDGYAGPDTYVWVPVHNAVIDYDDRGDDVSLELENYGELRVEAGPGVDASTSVHVHVPIQIERPYGREYLLINARVYYMVASSAKLELARIRGRDFSSGELRTMGQNLDDGVSTVYDDYTIYATGYYTVTATQAPVALELFIDMPNSASTFYLYGVRLRLDSTY